MLQDLDDGRETQGRNKYNNSTSCCLLQQISPLLVHIIEFLQLLLFLMVILWDFVRGMEKNFKGKKLVFAKKKKILLLYWRVGVAEIFELKQFLVTLLKSLKYH